MKLSWFTDWILSHALLHLFCILDKVQLSWDWAISKNLYLHFPTDASPVVELHHGPGMVFYSFYLCLLNAPVVLSAWRDFGLQRRKLYFELSCRPASGLWGINFIVFFPFLYILHCWSLKRCCFAGMEKWGEPWNPDYSLSKLFPHLLAPKASLFSAR